MRIKLINEFHQAEVVVIAKRENDLHYVSYAAYKRAINKLCGIKGCQCGGIRGGDYQLEPVCGYFPRADRYAVYYQDARV